MGDRLQEGVSVLQLARPLAGPVQLDADGPPHVDFNARTGFGEDRERDVADDSEVDITARMILAGCERAKDECTVDPGEPLQGQGDPAPDSPRLHRDGTQFRVEGTCGIRPEFELPTRDLGNQYAGALEQAKLPCDCRRGKAGTPRDLAHVKRSLGGGEEQPDDRLAGPAEEGGTEGRAVYVRHRLTSVSL